MSFNPDAVLKTLGIVDEIVKENFLKINRIFQSTFGFSMGVVSGKLDGMAVGGTAFSLDWQKVGRQVTLHLNDDIIATKFETSDPRLAGTLPQALRPRNRVAIPIQMVNAGTLQTAAIYVFPDGTVTFPNRTGWTASLTTIYATSISYLGT